MLGPVNERNKMLTISPNSWCAFNQTCYLRYIYIRLFYCSMPFSREYNVRASSICDNNYFLVDLYLGCQIFRRREVLKINDLYKKVYKDGNLLMLCGY
ncbi:uncharacterized protein LOC108987219 isoform X2 [Juglans regia]|uniref:Uncharacterized protein LOC108987219 isoform X2 n=1 Tax=Juglans regia TaxID=51240 RepID=A0A2I4E8C5_JUGRE|nr:uncharacterized protein LOC108987219 isoform X2 [Juglans regia]